MKYKSFKPGKIWLDTNGNRIQAHGGSIIFVNGVYYWYGENKENTKGLDNTWHNGMRCYASMDLYNWEDKGIIIPAEEDDENSSLHPISMADRPHIIYNRETKKFVCWIKVMYSDGSQRQSILTANEILGPYKKVREGLKPLGMSGGDFDLVVAPDGKAYYYFERVHSETICADLTTDYLDVTGYYSTHFPHIGPPFVREATAYFNRMGKHYLLTSGTTGYLPNPSEIAIASTYHGPFTVLGNPHRNDKTNTSFHSQITSVFKVPGKKDLYIALADRWLPEEMKLKYSEYGEAFKKLHCDGLNFDDLSENEMSFFKDLRRNTSIADYVWLPLVFEDDMVYIDWKDDWKIEDYE